MPRIAVLLVGLLLALCALPVSAAEPEEVKLALNWVAEPEFGGFYQAQEDGAFARHGLNVTILPGGAGAPVVQMVAAGQVPFAIASADEVVIARARGANLVALFAVYQDCPQGIMVHKSLGLKSLEEVFASDLTLAMEVGLPYGKFLKQKYQPQKLQIVPYAGGVAQFLREQRFAQQCFVTSEPLAARGQGAKPQTFLIAESGYNPYTAVVVTTDEYLQANRAQVQAMVLGCRQGWESYLKDPAKANAAMLKLNTAMDAATFAAVAKEQESLIVNEQTKKGGLGTMTVERWQTLGAQLVGLKIIDQAPPAAACFVNLAAPEQPAAAK